MGILDKLRGGTPEERAAKAVEQERIKAALGMARAQQQALEQAARAAADRQRAEAAAKAEADRQGAYIRACLGDELYEFQVNSPADAKIAIKLARIRKKEIAAEKRELSTNAAEERERWRERQAGRLSTTALGRGTSGRMMRGAVQAKRRSEKLEHAGRLNDVSDQRQELDRAMVVVDRLLIELERKAVES